MKETEHSQDNYLEDIKTHFMNTIWEQQTDYERAESKLIELIERYATAKAKASCEATLKKASEKAVVRGYCAGCERAGLLHCAHADSCGSNVVIVDKSSINHPSNIVIV